MASSLRCRNAIFLTVSYSLFVHHVGEEEDDAAFEAPKVYEPIESLEQVSARLQMQQAMYNEAIRGSVMDLVFFKVSCIDVVNA